jgi:hypothetical protein
MTRDNPLVALTWQVYRLLLMIYPANYRREFGREMSLAFHDYCRRTVRQKGVYGLFQIWLITGVDLVATALMERLTEVREMSSHSVARLLGAIGTLGGLYAAIVGVVWLAVGEQTPDSLPFLPFYTIAIAIGCLGLFLKSDSLGPDARFGAAVAFIGMAMGTVGMVLMLLEQDGGWLMWFIGALLLHPLGLILVGATSQGLPAFWKATPILTGALTIALMVISLAPDGSWLFGLLMVLFGTGWILIGQMPIFRVRAEARA